MFTWRCQTCNNIFWSEELPTFCPKCSSRDIVVQPKSEVRVKSVTYTTLKKIPAPAKLACLLTPFLSPDFKVPLVVSKLFSIYFRRLQSAVEQVKTYSYSLPTRAVDNDYIELFIRSNGQSYAFGSFVVDQEDIIDQYAALGVHYFPVHHPTLKAILDRYFENKRYGVIK